MRLIAMGVLIAACSTLVLAEQYYRYDPQRLAELEAERCKRIKKEQALIRKRLSRPVNRPVDVKKMKSRLQVLDESAVRYCPVNAASRPDAAAKR